MKECTVCSAKWDDNVAFCGNCGGALEAVDNADTNVYEDDKTVAAGYGETPAFIPTPIETTPVENTAQDTAVQTSNPYAPVNDDNTVASSTVENSYMPENSAIPQADDTSYFPEGFDGNKPEKKGIKKPLIISLVAALVVIGVVVTGFLTNWFGLGAPLNGLFKAAENMTEIESAKIKISGVSSIGDKKDNVKMDLKFNMDKDEETLSVISNGYNDDKMCLYDDVVYMINSSGRASKIDADTGELFDAIKEAEEEELDWDELVEQADLEDYVDADEIDEFLKTLYEDYFSDKGWLEEYLGFEKDGDDYIFEPDIKKLGKEIINICDDSDVFTKKGKENIKEGINEFIEQAQDAKIKAKLTITVDSGYITAVVLDVTGENDGEKASVKFTVDITDINDTEISESEAKKIKNEVEQIIADHECTECGEWVYDDEKDAHGDCYDCGEHFSYLNEYSGHYYCDDCYDDQSSSTMYGTNSGYCWDCGDYASRRYDYLCFDCYLDS